METEKKVQTGMNRHFRALELDKILTMLAAETSSGEGAELALEIRPVYTVPETQMLLNETDAAFQLTAKFGAPSFYGLKNITNQMRRAQAGASLNMHELLDIAQTLRALRALKQWRQKSQGVKTAIDDRFQVLGYDKALEDKIFTSIKSEEEMADAASPALAAIRRKIRNATAGIRDKLEKLVRSQSHQKHLQDAIITMRSGRFVVPVKNEHRNEVPGLIHDSSSSGATVFVEPMAVVEANNEIRVLQADEIEEINRVLLQLSGEAGAIADGIIESYRYAIELDLIFAKAHLAYKMKAILPRINADGRTVLHTARHPLIDRDKVVPTEITLGVDFETLIITGPNTGGKTVALKTIGLLTLMAMCGLMIPAGEESEIAIYRHILSDIGDEQSIEQSLSTFSAHMTNIIRILKQADKDSLVLLDELGAGTDPVEGAALATSIIEELREKGAKLACTTHYAELKAYAIETEGVENGCCEFDVATLRPTYRLLIGVPGKSNAFAISLRLGMDKTVVERAEALVASESTRFEDVVGKLEESRRQMENQTEELNRDRIEARQAALQAKRIREDAEKLAAKEIDRARQEAERIVAQTRAQSNTMLNELEELRKKQNKVLTAEQKAKMRADMLALEGMANPVRERKNEKYQLPRALKTGDAVLIYDIDKKATVLEEPKDGSVFVQAGIIKTRVDIKNLRLLEGQKQEKGSRNTGHRTVTKTNISSEAVTDLDLRGQNADEALMEVDAALDRAVMMGIKRMMIIHGKGTGILRNAVQQHLRHCKPVKSFRLGTYGEGEDGVTVVELK